MLKAIIVTGSVGSGKTTVAKKLARKYRYKYVDVNKLIKEKRLYDDYDSVMKSYIVDTPVLVKFLRKMIEKSKKKLVIDSHMSHYLPKKYVEVCVVTTCDLLELKKRLKRRKYPKAKFEENMNAEIFEVCLMEAQEKGHTISIVDTTKEVKDITL